MTRLFPLLLLALIAAADTARAQARTVRLSSPTYGGAERIASVLLPEGYAESTRRYPVLYLLHGGGQNHTAFMARRRFPAAARRNAMIVVMPAGDRIVRGAEGRALYETFLATDLVSFVDAQYRTVAAPEGRAIAGISQGGGFAASTALRYPGVFGVVGAFSPAFRAEPGEARAGAPPASAAPYFYVSCGTADSLLPASRQLVERLESGGFPHEYHELPGRGHTWDLWDEQIEAFIEVLAARGGWRH